MYLLSNMAILSIHVSFRECKLRNGLLFCSKILNQLEIKLIEFDAWQIYWGETMVKIQGTATKS